MVDGLVDACDVPPRGWTWKQTHGRKTPLSFRSLEDIFYPLSKDRQQDRLTEFSHKPTPHRKVGHDRFVVFCHRKWPTEWPLGLQKGVFGLGWVSLSGKDLLEIKNPRVCGMFFSSWTLLRIPSSCHGPKTWFESTFFYGHFWVKKTKLPSDGGFFGVNWEARSVLIWVPFSFK